MTGGVQLAVSARVLRCFWAMSLLLLAACASNPLDDASVEPLSRRIPSDSLSARLSSQVAVVDRQSEDPARPRNQLRQSFQGSGQFWKAQDEPAPTRNTALVVPLGNEEVTLNLVNVTVAEAAKAILGDALGANYVIDDRIQARVTLQTTRPVAVSSLLRIFETVLNANGAAIVEMGSGTYKLIPAAEANLGTLPIRVRGMQEDTSGVGRSVQVVPLRYVAAADMQRILEPIAPQGSILRVDETRNLVFLAGTAGELKSLFETIDTFDVDWLQGMSFALIPVKASDPATMAKELETVFSTGEGGLSKGVVRFIPNRRLKAILVLSTQGEYLQRAADWVTRLDSAAEATERQLFVYNVQNRGAKELAAVLQSLISPRSQASTEAVTPVAPRYEPTQFISGKGDRQAAAADYETAPPPPPLVPTVEVEETLRVVADEANNALLIFATIGARHAP
jgi:general secretion pathway protein D